MKSLRLYSFKLKNRDNNDNRYFMELTKMNINEIENYHYMRTLRGSINSFDKYVKRNGLKNFEITIIKEFHYETKITDIIEDTIKYTNSLKPRWYGRYIHYCLDSNIEMKDDLWLNTKMINLVFNHNHKNLSILTNMLRKSLPEEIILLVYEMMTMTTVNKIFSNEDRDKKIKNDSVSDIRFLNFKHYLNENDYNKYLCD